MRPQDAPCPAVPPRRRLVLHAPRRMLMAILHENLLWIERALCDPPDGQEDFLVSLEQEYREALAGLRALKVDFVFVTMFPVGPGEPEDEEEEP